MPVKFRWQALPSAGIWHIYCAEENDGVSNWASCPGGAEALSRKVQLEVHSHRTLRLSSLSVTQEPAGESRPPRPLAALRFRVNRSQTRRWPRLAQARALLWSGGSLDAMPRWETEATPS